MSYTECCSVNTQLDPLQCEYFLSHDAVTLLPGLDLACSNMHVSVQVKHSSVKIANKKKWMRLELMIQPNRTAFDSQSLIRSLL